MTDYQTFVSGKLQRALATGIPDAVVDTRTLFPFQADLTQWALRRGRAALFADTGLGKSRMEVTWANEVAKHTGLPVLVTTPLAVALQMQAEAASVGIDARVVKDGSEVTGQGVYIANLERLHRFEDVKFGGVAIDESSILKSLNSKTRRAVTDRFMHTPFRLAASATPSPNDTTELGNHAEFLGVCSRAEMLAEYFVHDGGSTQDWRLKGHARQAFWKFVASWAALVRSPADLGYDGSTYILPPLNVHHHTVGSGTEVARSLMERRAARRDSVDARVAACAGLANSDNEPWIVWCDLNAESAALAASIRGAVEVTGSMKLEEKEAALESFTRGDARVLVSKPSICGFGMNWQHAARMAFVGVTDSWEAYYQAVRREWRFGQKRPVDVHIFASVAEGAVVENLRRKEAAAKVMADELSQETASHVRSEVKAARRVANTYDPQVPISLPSWLAA